MISVGQATPVNLAEPIMEGIFYIATLSTPSYCEFFSPPNTSYLGILMDHPHVAVASYYRIYHRGKSML